MFDNLVIDDGLKSLNYDVLTYLFRFLEFNDLVAMKSVSDVFSEAANHHLKRVRHLVVGKSWSEYSEWCGQSAKRMDRTKVSHFCSTITIRRLEFKDTIAEIMADIADNCKDIESVTLFDCDLCLAFIEAFVHHFERLTTWTFIDISGQTFSYNRTHDFAAMGRALTGRVECLYLSLEKCYTSEQSVGISLIFENMIPNLRHIQWI